MEHNRTGIGYRHLQKNMEGSIDLPIERRKAWVKFEDVRELLYERYRQITQDNGRLSDSILHSALREVMCDAKNRDVESVVAQWREVVEKYTTEDKYQPVRAALLEVLDSVSKEK